mgnify:FL=1
MRLKIEINTREHFNILGLKPIPFKVSNTWYSGECNLISYELEELLGTKLRALYQRRKGRDLFDLYWAILHNDIDPSKVLECYHKYMSFVVEQPPTYKQFLANMEEKMKDHEFLSDMVAIIRPNIDYNATEAWEKIKTTLIEKI